MFGLPEFRALWFAEIMSIFGDQMARVALSVLVYTSPNSVWQKSVATAQNLLLMTGSCSTWMTSPETLAPLTMGSGDWGPRPIEPQLFPESLEIQSPLPPPAPALSVAIMTRSPGAVLRLVVRSTAIPDSFAARSLLPIP